MANEEMIQKHLDNFLAKIAGETPVDDEPRDSTEFWLNEIAEQGGGGTEVIANPTLAGTEAALTGLEVDGTKYKVPKGSYIAANTNNTTISSESHDYIVANWETVPCYFAYGPDHRLFRVTDVDGRTIHANSPIWDGASQGQEKLICASIGSTSDTIYIDTIYISTISANPGNGTMDLTSLKVRNVNYKVRDGVTNGLGYLTTAPTAANTDGIKIVVLSAEPAAKYNGYLYIILA